MKGNYIPLLREACQEQSTLMNGRYWALLGRPRGIVQTADVRMLQCTAKRLIIPLELHPTLAKNIQAEMSSALLDLITVSGKMIERLEHGRGQHDRHDYLMVVALDRELETWYNNLPEAVRWTPMNLQTANSDFFLFQ